MKTSMKTSMGAKHLVSIKITLLGYKTVLNNLIYRQTFLLMLAGVGVGAITEGSRLYDYV